MAQLPELELLTTGEVAKLFNTTSETIRRWAREGKIPSLPLPSGRVKFRREDVDKILDGYR